MKAARAARTKTDIVLTRHVAQEDSVGEGGGEGAGIRATETSRGEGSAAGEARARVRGESTTNAATRATRTGTPPPIFPAVGASCQSKIAGAWDPRTGIIRAAHSDGTFDVTLDYNNIDAFRRNARLNNPVPLKGKSLDELRAVAMPVSCDRCDGPHPTDACPHFKKSRSRWGSFDRTALLILFFGLAFLCPGVALLVISKQCEALDDTVVPGEGVVAGIAGCRVKAVHMCGTGRTGAVVERSSDASCRKSGKGAVGLSRAYQCVLTDITCDNGRLKLAKAAITLTPFLTSHGNKYCPKSSTREEVEAFCQKTWPANMMNVSVWEYADHGMGMLGVVDYSLERQHQRHDGLIAVIVIGSIIVAASLPMIAMAINLRMGDPLGCNVRKGPRKRYEGEDQLDELAGRV